MNISSHILIDVVILSTALTITLVLRAKGNAARKEKGNNWLLKKKKKSLKNLIIFFKIKPSFGINNNIITRMNISMSKNTESIDTTKVS